MLVREKIVTMIPNKSEGYDIKFMARNGLVLLNGIRKYFFFLMLSVPYELQILQKLTKCLKLNWVR